MKFSGRYPTATLSAMLLAALVLPSANALLRDGPIDIAWMLKRSDKVFAGTVTRIRTARNPEDSVVITTVVFRNLKHVRGHETGDSTTLQMYGGHLGDDYFYYAGEPEFAAGRRYIVFTRDHHGRGVYSYAPVVGHTLGVMIVSDATGGARNGEVRDASGRRVVGVRNERFLVFREKNRERPGTDQSGQDAQRSESTDPYQEVDHDVALGLTFGEPELLNEIARLSRLHPREARL